MLKFGNTFVNFSGTYLTGWETYIPPPPTYILHLTINGGNGASASMVWDLTPNALSGTPWQPWGGTQIPQSGVDAINSTSQNNAYPYAISNIYWCLGESYSPISFKYKSDNNTWRSLTAELYSSEEPGSMTLIDSAQSAFYTGATKPVTITL